MLAWEQAWVLAPVLALAVARGDTGGVRQAILPGLVALLPGDTELVDADPAIGGAELEGLQVVRAMQRPYCSRGSCCPPRGKVEYRITC